MGAVWWLFGGVLVHFLVVFRMLERHEHVTECVKPFPIEPLVGLLLNPVPYPRPSPPKTGNS